MLYAVLFSVCLCICVRVLHFYFYFYFYIPFSLLLFRFGTLVENRIHVYTFLRYKNDCRCSMCVCWMRFRSCYWWTCDLWEWFPKSSFFSLSVCNCVVAYDCMFQRKELFWDQRQLSLAMMTFVDVIRSRAADFIVLISIINTLWHDNACECFLCIFSFFFFFSCCCKHGSLVIDLCHSIFVFFFFLNFCYYSCHHAFASWNLSSCEYYERQCFSTICLLCVNISVFHRLCDVEIMCLCKH